tara:strand:+ start:12493 stop:13044 length:552 start_codon:yes stop_codon:yes gene_type:complete
MLNKAIIDPYGVEIISYNAIFGNITVRLVNELHDLDLINDHELNDDTCRRVIIHNILYELCEYLTVRSSSADRPVFLINELDLTKLEICNYYNHECFIKLHRDIIQIISRLIGIKFITSNISYNQYVDRLHAREGDLVDEIISISTGVKPRNLGALFKYANDNGLIAIKDKFFNEYTFKKVLI